MRKIKLFFLCLLVLGTFGCERVLELNLDGLENKMVANSILSPDSLLMVHLSYSQTLNGGDNYVNIEDGIVTILESGPFGSQTHSLNHVGDGNYSGNSTVRIGQLYELFAHRSSGDSIDAICQIPSKIEISGHVLTENVDVDENGDSLDQLSVTFNDPAEEDNFYTLALFRVDSLFGVSDTFVLAIPISIDSDDPEVNLISPEGVYFSDQEFQGNEKVFSLKIPHGLLESFQKVNLLFANVSKDYYLYGTSSERFQNSNINGLENQVLVHSNINGGIGIFAGFALDVYPLN